MKNRVISIVIVCVIIIIGVISINFFMSNNSNKDEAKPINDGNISELRSTVEKGFVENIIKMEGVVSNHNIDEVVIVESELKDKDKKTVVCKVYSDVKKGDVLFKIGNKEYTSPVNGKVREIVDELNYIMVGIIDYDALIIDARTNYIIADKMIIGGKVIVKESNPLAVGEEYEETILGFGFEVDDNCKEVYISNSKNFLPGTEVSVEYKYTNDIESCYILKQMLLQDIDGYYVFIYDDEGREKRKVSVGKEFTMLNAGNVTEFVEILEGLSEGEKLVVDTMSDE